MKLPVLIETYKEDIVPVCKKHYAKERSVFGSTVHNDFSMDSYIDLLVAYDYAENSKDPLENRLTLKVKLESMLHRNVDLVAFSQLPNKFLRYFIKKESQVIYA